MRWTEKQIEDYLQEETRELTGPDGRSTWFTMYRMQWITYDAVRVVDAYTEADLVAKARRRVAEEGISPSEALRGTVDWIDHRIRELNGWR